MKIMFILHCLQHIRPPFIYLLSYPKQKMYKIFVNILIPFNSYGLPGQNEKNGNKIKYFCHHFSIFQAQSVEVSLRMKYPLGQITLFHGYQIFLCVTYIPCYKSPSKMQYRQVQFIYRHRYIYVHLQPSQIYVQSNYFPLYSFCKNTFK